MSTRTVRRVVVKVGSAVVAPGGRMNQRTLERIADELAELRSSGVEVILVSSGAVSSGFRALGLNGMPGSTRQKQAAAAIGQPTLLRTYAERLAAHRVTAAQVLLTADDFGHRERFLNARDTLLTLLEAGVIPVINENDSVVFDEIKLGDNDRLGALAATSVDADLLVLLSQAPGLLDTTGGSLIPKVTSIAEARRYVDESMSSGVGTGGMASKLDALAIAMEAGVPAVLTAGPTHTRPRPISEVTAAFTDGSAISGTWFDRGDEGVLTARKSWIAHAAASAGRIVVDAGAATAVSTRGASLLPGGILRVDGHFKAGTAVEITDESGRVIARGLAAYNSAEIDRIKGLKSEAIAGLLGYSNSDVVVHRDDLQITGAEQ